MRFSLMNIFGWEKIALTTEHFCLEDSYSMPICISCFGETNGLLCLVIRASVPKLELDSVFEQKNQIAKAVEEELEKVAVPLVMWLELVNLQKL